MTTYVDTYVPLNRDKPKRSGKTPEAKVSDAINKYLKKLPCLVLRTGAGAIQIDGRWVRIGKAGTSDKTLLFQGGVWASLEEKATTTLTPNQSRYKLRVEALGGLFIEARSVADVRAALVDRFGEDVVNGWEKAK